MHDGRSTWCGDARNCCNWIGAKANIKIGGVKKNANAEEDDDDWEGENEEEKDVLIGGKRSALPKPGTPDNSPHPLSDPDSALLQSVRGKHVTHALKDEAANQDDPREKDSSENKHDRVQDAKARGLTQKPAQKTSKQKSKAQKEEEEEVDDDDGEDLDGFLVEDAEEEDAEVVTTFPCTRLQLVYLMKLDLPQIKLPWDDIWQMTDSFLSASILSEKKTGILSQKVYYFQFVHWSSE